MKKIQDFVNLVVDNIETVIIGQRKRIELLMTALLIEGHVLLEDVPGVGKTMLARSMAISLGGAFRRLQCTPDLLPNDVTGVSVYDQKNSTFKFRPGPVFVNILLADEINRATPRTQSALLEAMQEQQVTVDGETRRLPKPFLVMATQNPIEYEGTFPLPEAQLDRFLIRMSLGYPKHDEEKSMLQILRREHPIQNLQPVVEASELLNFQEMIWDVYLDDTLQEYILALVEGTRKHPGLALGVSPRGSLALFKIAQAYAALNGRDHVLPEDLRYLLPYTFSHRIIVKPEAVLRGKTPESIIDEILKTTPLDLGSIES